MMDDIYLIVRMQMELLDDRQCLCDGIGVVIDNKDAIYEAML